MFRIRATSIFSLLLFALAMLGNSQALRAQLCCQGFRGYEYHCTSPTCDQYVLVRNSCIRAQYSGHFGITGSAPCCQTQVFTYTIGTSCYITAPQQASSEAPSLLARSFYMRDCSGKYVLVRLGGPSTS
jgi:hypothetical protein